MKVNHIKEQIINILLHQFVRDESFLIMSVPHRSSDILTDLQNLQQSANEGLSVVRRIRNNNSEEIILNISPIGSAARCSLRDGVDKDLNLTSVSSVMNGMQNRFCIAVYNNWHRQYLTYISYFFSCLFDKFYQCRFAYSLLESSA